MTGVWHSEIPLPDYPANLARMLNENAARFAEGPIYQEVHDGRMEPLPWAWFQAEVAVIQAWLQTGGFAVGDRLAILSRNRREMLELELAVMALGGIAVPIFAGYSPDQTNALVEFCRPAIVAVADQSQYDKLTSPDAFSAVIHFDNISAQSGTNQVAFTELLAHSTTEPAIAGNDIPTGTVALMMYTSGTMGKPKCVQLTHGNILSQQAAMRVLWNLSASDRLLSYLPWHHSFGGIFEKYAAITNGAVLSLEHGFGKDLEVLLENWRRVKPTIFFSVPRIYQEIITRTAQDPEIDRLIFHDQLRFIFTAAAPLPSNISAVFEQRGIPVIEGWGLTETSPCCTVTDPTLEREPGAVGRPIPGVDLKLADDGEILVKGANVMTGYFDNPEATAEAFTDDGWFRTGDVGEFTATGLRLISRRDRIFKLSNAEKVVPAEIENLIAADCVFLAQAYVTGGGRDFPVVLLFPNRAMLSMLPDSSRLKDGCQCPRSLDELASCLKNCLRLMNGTISARFARPQVALLLDRELSIDNAELTPSMKLAPNVMGKIFKAHIDYLYCEGEQPEQKTYVIQLV
ncbi:MAG: AMP-binding protein [Candidatus Neomarinimicrobiota bacterium]